MLVLNKFLQKTGVPLYIRLIWVNYFQLGAISGLLTAKSNAKNQIKHHSNILIQVAKSVNK